MAFKLDKELEMYRDLVKVPDRFEDGFGVKTIIGAIFLGFLMVPATLYLSLFIGAGLGSAPQWVTLILFSEVVKRSMKSLRQQEIYILFSMTGMVLGAAGSAQGLLWNQYFVQSPAAIALGVAPDIPYWVAPPKAILDQSGRTFFTQAWLPPIMLMIGMMIISRIDHFGLGYALYRLTVDVEKLPFPMAPASALGITALAEGRESKEKWRWRCFSLGAVLGLAWGTISVGLPAVTGALFTRPVTVFPIPWLDLTPAAQDWFPAVPISMTFDLGIFLVGMVIPFWAVVGGLISFILTLILNPTLQHFGFLPTWKKGMGVIDTSFSNHIDFYLSFGIGIMLAIFVVSLWPIIQPLFARKKLNQPEPGASLDSAGIPMPTGIWARLTHKNKDRGDFSMLTGLCIYVFSTLTYIAVCVWMMPGDENGKGRFPWLFFMGFGFIYTPAISYINAKLTGMIGQSVAIPLVREAAFILSGYQGAAIWFAPIPLNDYGGAASGFRVLELTGTRLTSVVKTDILVVPIIILCTILFSQLIWSLAPIPSEAYPYAQTVWHQNALLSALTMSSTLEGSSPFLEAIKPDLIAWGAGVGLAMFVTLSLVGLPSYLVYGLVRGLGGGGPGIIFELIGAFLARFYFEKRFKRSDFKQWIMVILAGYSAGVGLVSMAAVAIALIVKSTSTLGY